MAGRPAATTAGPMAPLSQLQADAERRARSGKLEVPRSTPWTHRTRTRRRWTRWTERQQRTGHEWRSTSTGNDSWSVLPTARCSGVAGLACCRVACSRALFSVCVCASWPACLQCHASLCAPPRAPLVGLHSLTSELGELRAFTAASPGDTRRSDCHTGSSNAAWLAAHLEAAWVHAPSAQVAPWIAALLPTLLALLEEALEHNTRDVEERDVARREKEQKAILQQQLQQQQAAAASGSGLSLDAQVAGGPASAAAAAALENESDQPEHERAAEKGQVLSALLDLARRIVHATCGHIIPADKPYAPSTPAPAAALEQKQVERKKGARGKPAAAAAAAAAFVIICCCCCFEA